MPYLAKERIHVNSQNRPCAADDPDVAVMVARPGAVLHIHEVERYGLKGDKRLVTLSPDAEDAPERGSSFYELTGQEPPVAKHPTRILGESAGPERGPTHAEMLAAREAPEPVAGEGEGAEAAAEERPAARAAEPATAEQEQAEPARSRRGR
jgi:hypothetical protein